MTHTDSTDVIVIGAGIIGACTAWNLARRGLKVALIDKDEPGRGCSFGNAGAISFGSVVPLAMPGVLRGAIGMLLDPEAPLQIPLTYLPRVAPWLRQFVAAAKPATVARLADALSTILTHSFESHEHLAREIGVPELIRRSGQLHVYPDDESLKKDTMSWRMRAEHGLRIEKLERSDIAALEPDIGPDYRAGYLTPDQGMSVNPYRYVLAVVDDFVRHGGELISDNVRDILLEGNQVVGVLGAQQCRLAFNVVICAGAWSMQLLSRLGYKIPLESQRGYHVMITQPGISLSRQVIAADRKVFFTPMEDGLRLAGTVEFGGLEKPPTRRRAQALVKHMASIFPAATIPSDWDFWMGHRPCLPDSLPVVGRSRHNGLWFNFGHGHLGLTMSATTGEMVARQVAGEPTNIDLTAFAGMRFDS
jgi:glycine/D-amino acid oxidase-like deaminating enzyme